MFYSLNKLGDIISYKLVVALILIHYFLGDRDLSVFLTELGSRLKSDTNRFLCFTIEN